jgi:bifunctional DNA-binding transcriptional regulator/antitoxin component of YhaV-PrlF toxin-antitoxin module
MTIADAVWVATAQLHRDDLSAQDFSVQEIMGKATDGKLVGFTPGLQVHVSKHCVANKSPNSEQHRMLFSTARGRRRLFKPGDPFHADRSKGKIHPDKGDLPVEYRDLIDWYENAYAKKRAAANESTATSPDESSPSVLSGKPVPVDFAERLTVASVVAGAGGEIVIPMNIRSKLGIKEGTRITLQSQGNCLILQPINEEFIDRLCGSYRGKTSLVEAWDREHRIER